MILHAVLNYNPWRNGDKQWTKVVNELQGKFEEIVTIRTVRGRIKTLTKKLISNDLQYKSGVAEEEDSEIINLLRMIIDFEEEEKAAMNNARATRKLSDSTTGFVASAAGQLPKVVPVVVSGSVPVDVAANVLVDGSGDIDEPDDDPPRRLSAAKQRKLEKDEADLERGRYLDEASGPLTSRKGRQRITKEEELINQRLELDIQIEKDKLIMQQEQLEAEKIRALKREEHEMQMEKSKFETEKQRSEDKLQLEKERLTLEKLRESRKEREAERRDEITKMSVDIQSKMIDMMTKFLDK